MTGSRKGKETMAYLRRRRTVLRFRRLVFWSALICLCVYIAYHCAEKLARPYFVDWQEARDIARIKHEINAVAAENRDLRRQIAYLQTDAGIEAEARKLGMVKEGEVALVVEAQERNELTRTEKAPSPRWQSVMRRIASIFVKPRKPSRG